jgi:hypothetical protein
VFPQEIEITLILKLTVETQEERNNWLEPETKVIQIDALADIKDILECDGLNINTINGFTGEQLQNILNNR